MRLNQQNLHLTKGIKDTARYSSSQRSKFGPRSLQAVPEWLPAALRPLFCFWFQVDLQLLCLKDKNKSCLGLSGAGFSTSSDVR